MDYGRLRAAALQDGEDEEAVTVDTRALIDKVLARYSGEWTTLRELIQNAADAQATTVKVRWETLPSTQVPLPAVADRSEILKHVITHHTLRRLVVQNDGQPFTKTDWGRLKRIAEGNPDETKIGAFGVGFYSVFADCEEPFISSGSEAMAFYWKGNALFTRKLQLSEGQCSPDTAFVLDYRNTTTTLPNLLSVSQFLATSLTFVALEHIEFWIDDYKILSLQKKASPNADVTIPKDMDRATRERLMAIRSAHRSSAQIDASYMSAIGWKPQIAAAKSEAYGLGTSDMPSLRSFFSRITTVTSTKAAKAAREEKAAQAAISEDITALSTSSIFIRVTTGNITTSVSPTFASELERATKKPPPKLTKLSVLTSSYDETQASENSRGSSVISTAADIFASVLPTKKGGRIFIGFPTTQTTGGGMHISAPSVIPTVEREAIDLNARWVRTWNLEMLRVAGIMARLAFTYEMAELQTKLQRAAEAAGTGITSKETAVFMPEALHVLKAFTFGDSTPSGHVSQTIEEAFWTAYKKPFVEIYSTRGVLPTSKVRLSSPELGNFVESIAVVPPELETIGFVRKLIDFDLLSQISVDDIYEELSGKPLTEAQLPNFIQWVAKKSLQDELSVSNRDRLLDVAVAVVNKKDDSDGSGHGDVIALGSIRNFMASQKIPPGLPLPPTTIPSDYTKSCSIQELRALPWEPLDLLPWLSFLIETRSSRSPDQDITKSPEFATRILIVVSKGWENQSQFARDKIASLLKDHTIMPTKLGMRKPTESFFPSVKLFDDLPIIQCSQLKDKFLSALGVRKTVDLETIFRRLLRPSSEKDGPEQAKWSHVELIKYLASVSADIPADDLKKLRESRICPAEAGPPGKEFSQLSPQLYKVSELYGPNPLFRPLQLNIIQWPGGSLNYGSPEGKFLAALGLRMYPSVPKLVDLMASPDQQLREDAMTYFISQYYNNNYKTFNIATSNRAFLPLQGDPKQLVSPSECFSNESVAILGFNILKKELHYDAQKFGVSQDPPILDCVQRLIKNPPNSRQVAVPVFRYFSGRINDLSDTVTKTLSNAQIVPVTRKTQVSGIISQRDSDSKTNPVIHLSPRQCYLGTSIMYEDIFDFVDFGPPANAFLSHCGSNHEPTKLEIARLAAGEPARLLSVLRSPDKYLNLLRSLAGDMPTIKRDKELWKKMKTAPFLLAFKEISNPKGKGAEQEEDEESVRTYQLAAPSNIVILDDIISYRLFKEHLKCAPEEDALESFYQALGSPTLSATVLEELTVGPLSEKQDGGVWLRKHVLERSKLFIHEYARYTRDSIKHDAKWLEKNLSVVVVRSISLCRSLRISGQSHVEKRSAASSLKPPGWVLYVASDSSRPDMYQVGQAICQLILNRPSHQAYSSFEPFLKLDLLDLRARGYNVDRILRAKATEARIAEEERRKALDAEQAQIRQREREFAKLNQAASTSAVAASREQNRTPPPRMPGGFHSPDDDDLPSSLPQPSDNRKGRGIFSNLSKRFGFDYDDDEADEKLKSFTDSKPKPGLPPPPEPPSSGSRPGRDGQDTKVTNPAVVQQNLLNAIKSTRAYDSSLLYSPPTTREVKEQATYCDDTAAKDLTLLADASNGMRVFISSSLPQTEMGAFLSSNHTAINSFAALLKDVGDVYQIPKNVLHVFYDEGGNTIAFNRDGSIFCNLRFFIQLHVDQSNGENRASAAVWWWVVLAHELAHNIIQPHNADHSYYTESFIQQYFPKMMLKATSLISSSSSIPSGLQAPLIPERRNTAASTPPDAPPPYRER
ncbi:putative hatpase c domain-containing protein [Rosellinia necatrix]|uniref:Putative hatpase c domain-containing protein n=1 Tax=Rosellinia necatrix TaxID=77044 RepID=A0A1W2TT34_ROSNE|nr:putative hatpase c domain-containing protein [Rosellinia necatrix]